MQAIISINGKNTQSVVITFTKSGTISWDIADVSIVSGKWGGSLINSFGNKYNIYGTKVDGMGEYTLQNIPTGKYLIFMISNKTTSGSAFSDKVSYENRIADLLSGGVNTTNAEYMGKLHLISPI